MTLLLGDCRVRLGEVEPESIDLIYLDPPFNTRRTWTGDAGSFQDSEFPVSDDDRAWFSEATRRVLAAAREPDRAYFEYMGIRLLALHRRLKPTGSLYLHCDHRGSAVFRLLLDSIFGESGFRREVIWAYDDTSGFKSTANNWVRAHDSILYYAKGKGAPFNKVLLPLSEATMRHYRRSDEDGPFRVRARGQVSRLKGKAAGSVWTDISSFQTAARSPERAGYPTQKPLRLLRRIVEASSNPGDLVLDPFCGSGTTLVAASLLRRRHLGIDVSEDALALARRRLEAVEDPFAPDPGFEALEASDPRKT